jgi:hypothetical protein
MLKLAAIVGGALLMAGVAFAGTRTLLEQTSGPTLGTTVQPPAVTTTSRHENEVRGRENEVGEDLRGPCDEAEHANDPRCTGMAVTPAHDDNDDLADDRGDDDDRGRDDNSGPGERSGDEDGDDHSGHSGAGGGGDDD